jgi:hypothetical protein
MSLSSRSYLTTELKHATENRHTTRRWASLSSSSFSCTWKVHGALRTCVWRRPPLTYHRPLATDPSTHAIANLPSLYFASSAYSYSYAYSNTPPSSHQGRDRIHFDFPRSDPKRSPAGVRRTFGTPWPPPIRPPPSPAHNEDEHDGVRADYLYVPRASRIPSDLLSRRPSARAFSAGDVAVTSPSARA